MFDQLDWSWVYEPFDADGYIPDFLIVGKRPLLIEVKPDATTEQLAEHAQRVIDAVRQHWSGRDILFLGATPLPAGDDTWAAGLPTSGLLVESIGGDHAVADGQWCRCGKCGCWAVFHSEQSYACRPCGHYDGDAYLASLNPRHIEAMWAATSDKTRWRAR